MASVMWLWPNSKPKPKKPQDSKVSSLWNQKVRYPYLASHFFLRLQVAKYAMATPSKEQAASLMG